MNRKQLHFILFAIGLALFAYGCGPAASPEASQPNAASRAIPVEVAQVESGNIASVFEYTGDLQPEQSLTLVSLVSGAVEEVFVEVGDYVRTGDPILRVEDTTFRAQLKQAQSGLAQAQINIARMENGPRDEQVAMAEAGLIVAEANLSKLQKGPREEQIAIAEAARDGAQAQLEGVLTVNDDERTLAASQSAQAEAALRLAQAEYDKIKWAGQVGVTPQALQLQQATIAYETALAAYNRQVNPTSLDVAPLAAGARQAELSLALTINPFVEEDFALAEAGVQQAKAQLEITKNPFTAEDLALAEVGIRQAEAVVALAQFQLDNSILRAPFDGIVSEVFATTGSVASPQSPAITLISEDLEVQVQIPESQYVDVFPGQPAAIKVTAYPGQDFPSLVNTVAPAANPGSRTFPTTIIPLDEENRLRSGMFAEITILDEEKTNVILAPRSAIAVVGEQNVVYVLSEDETTAIMRPITLGLSDEERVEVVDGLSVGETIITAGLSNLSDGATVEVTARTQ